MRSEFASLRFAEKDQSFASLSLRILDTQIRRIAKKFAESSQKVILNFLKKDEFLTIFASLSSHFFVLKRKPEKPNQPLARTAIAGFFFIYLLDICKSKLQQY